MKVGSKVAAKITAPDSFYKAVEGTVTGIVDGWVGINATRVMSKWSRKMEAHPTSVALAVKIENVKLIA